MMKKPFGSMLILVLLTLALAGCGLLQEPAAPSGELEAVPLELATAPAEPAQEAEPAAPMVEATEASDAESAGNESTPETEAAASPPDAASEAPAAETGSSLQVYAIDPSASTVRFELDEVLRGNPITVVGSTNQIAGEIAVDLGDLSTAQVGVIQINARGLATDNNFRNRAIQNEILDTGAFEFITFTPTAVNALPASAAPGEQVEFTVDGDLTIRDITMPATFTVTATPLSATQLSGMASTVIERADFNLVIPQVPNVANVEEQVELYIDFVANAT